MQMFTVKSDFREGQYGPGARDGEAWQLLAEQRVKVRCNVRLSPIEQGSQTASALLAGKMKDTCHHMGEDVRYRPLLLIGNGEARQVLNPASIAYNFDARTPAN